MKNAMKVGFGFLVLCVLVCGWLFLRRSGAPDKRTTSVVRSDTTKPVVASKANATAEASQSRPSSPHLVSEAEVRQFRLFSAGLNFFNQATADKLQLSEDERTSIRFVIWEYKRKFDRVIADNALVKRTSDGVITASFELGDKADKLRSDFQDDLRNVVGDKRWQDIEASTLLDEIDRQMEYWGKYPTAYSFTLEPQKNANNESFVKIDIISEKTPWLMHSHAFPMSMFAAIYGPLADKIGL